MNLRRLLIIHTVLTLSAGLVLIAAPELIPRAVGIRIEREAYLLCYLLAAAELSLAALSFLSLRVSDAKAVRTIVVSFLVLHTASAILEILAFFQGVSAKIWGNVALRVIAVLLFLYYGFKGKEERN
jgi:hypothetical protein